MALLSISAAARAVGKDRGTIYKKISEGKLSAQRDSEGNTRIDTAELLRVFGALSNDGETSSRPVVEPVKASQGADSELIAVLKQQLEEAKGREEKLWKRLEEAEAASKDLIRLLPAPAPAAERKEQGREGKKDHTDTLALALFALFLAGFAWLILWR